MILDYKINVLSAKLDDARFYVVKSFCLNSTSMWWFFFKGTYEETLNFLLTVARTSFNGKFTEKKNDLVFCKRLSFYCFRTRQRAPKREPSAEGARNERFSANEVCWKQTDVFTLVPSGAVAPSSFSGKNTWSVAQTMCPGVLKFELGTVRPETRRTLL